MFVLVVLKPVPNPDLEIRGMGGGEGEGEGEAVIQTLRLEGGPQSPNFFFGLSGLTLLLKLREGAPGGSATEKNTL